jgi:hypothetical protein
VEMPRLDRHTASEKSVAPRGSPGPMRKSMGTASAMGKRRIHGSRSHQDASAVMVNGMCGGSCWRTRRSSRPYQSRSESRASKSIWMACAWGSVAVSTISLEMESGSGSGGEKESMRVTAMTAVPGGTSSGWYLGRESSRPSRQAIRRARIATPVVCGSRNERCSGRSQAQRMSRGKPGSGSGGRWEQESRTSAHTTITGRQPILALKLRTSPIACAGPWQSAASTRNWEEAAVEEAAPAPAASSPADPADG